MWSDLAIGPMETLNVVLSTVGIYCTFLILIRVLGQRTMATMSSFDFAAVIAMGSVAGRAILGPTPNLAAGAVGIATLFILQAVAGQIRRNRYGASAVRNQPQLLMAGPEILHQSLLRAHIVEEELHAKLRLAGVRNTSEVACVILESTGSVSVLRRGEPIDAALVAGIRDIELLPADLLRPPSAGA